MIKRFFIVALMLFTAVEVNSEELDETLIQSSTNPVVLQQGKVLFEQVCASCHNKDLSGASGFNLKDGEWVHGKRPSEILNNVKNGFMSAGMPGFADVFSEQQLRSIVSYVLSKREGWDDLQYKLYQLDNEHDQVVREDKLIKSGQLAKNLADFAIPEVQDYFIEFEGDFYAPKDKDAQLWLEWGAPHEMEVFINGKQVQRGGTPWFPTWRLKRGKQRLKLTYRSGNSKPGQRNLTVIATNLDMTIKLFAVSSRAKVIMDGKKFEIKATSDTIVLRKRIHKLPPLSISVGMPTKLNYAFNSKTCSINGLWQGDLLNIGPNISGRGEDPSLPLGEWVFKSPQGIKHATDAQQVCSYKGYQLVNSNPVFNYAIGDTNFSVTAIAKHSNKISFLFNSNNENKTATLRLPASENLIWSSENGKITADKAVITTNSKGSFELTASIEK
ncbi:c-type cytochrome [Pseudoalteromonas shioyasakiensis]|uniref:c-type cytochrome n=1 Tax=Pseudoalteromonas shioyasakiensis TaxID=1190813 RepID=UPI002118683C|nr:c-type cytochrome [Pseudoalteromonas shioyasakiensis]MCQ8876580.1 c-type cytochrome [Pseudoalteromonas shioyasakiensis]